MHKENVEVIYLWSHKIIVIDCKLILAPPNLYTIQYLDL